MSPPADLVYLDPPFNTKTKRSGSSGTYNDSLPDGEYYEFCWSILEAVRSCLSDTGTIVWHCDWRTSHRVRCIMDGVFGQQRFLNEIIWCYNSGGASRTKLASKHDTLFWYSKSDQWTFTEPREPYPRDYGNRPGFHPDGKVWSDWWIVPIMSTTSSERTGYPTQKPIELLRKVITMATNSGDLVVDPFCGSGTTLVVAAELGRRFFGGDSNPQAVEIAKGRLGIS